VHEILGLVPNIKKKEEKKERRKGGREEGRCVCTKRQKCKVHDEKLIDLMRYRQFHNYGWKFQHHSNNLKKSQQGYAKNLTIISTDIILSLFTEYFIQQQNKHPFQVSTDHIPR
jgi:hypothetical protein